MKNFITITSLFFTSIILGQNREIDNLFTSFNGRENVTSINISKSMFNLIGGATKNSSLGNFKPLLKDVKKMKILIIDDDLTAKLELDNGLNKMKYETLMTVNSDGSNINIIAQKVTEGIVQDLLIKIDDKSQSIVLLMDGSVKIEDISILMNELDTSSKSHSYNNSTSREVIKVSPNVNINNDSKIQNEIREVGKFDQIIVSAGIKVIYSQDKKEFVKVETDEGKLQYISTTVENGVLKIKIDSPIKNLRFKKILVHVSSPQLNNVRVSSGASMNIQNLKQPDLDVKLSSGSALTGNVDIKNNTDLMVSSGAALTLNIQTNNLSLNGSSGMSATLKGKANNVTFKISSGAVCNAFDLEAMNVTANVSSAGSLKVFAKESLSITASTASNIQYKGNPKTFSETGPKSYTIKKVD